jgi:hypothetical protein
MRYKVLVETTKKNKQQQTPWLSLRKRTIPTVRPPFVGEVSATFSGNRVVDSKMLLIIKNYMGEDNGVEELEDSKK